MQITKIKNLFLLILLFPIVVFSEKINEFELNSDFKIILSPSSYKNYIGIIDKINESDSKTIEQKYKNNFFKIYGYFGDQLIKGQMRISGDWKDHIDANEHISSMSIALKDNNINGVVKFRLLIPKTKNNENEIFWSILMEQIGYPVPYKSFVNVDFNGKNRIFIFEEKPEKEFLESFSYRESPILEFDERQLWNIRENYYRKDGIVEKNLPQLKIKNSDFLKNKTAFKIAYQAMYPGNLNGEAISNFDDANIEYARHGLIIHNRKYIYDVMYNNYVPIYFDGMFKIENFECNPVFLNNYENNIHAIDLIKSKFIKRTLNMHEFTKKHVCLSNLIINKNSLVGNIFKTVRPLNDFSHDLNDFDYKILSEIGNTNFPSIHSFDDEKFEIKTCDYNNHTKKWDKCRLSENFRYIKNVFKGDDDATRSNNIRYLNIFPFFNLNFKPSYIEKYGNYNLDNTKKSISISDNSFYYLNGDIKNSELIINLEGKNSYFVIYDSKIINSKILINNPDNLKKDNSVRYNQKLITSCVSVIDSYISNSNFYAENCPNEDSINFIRTKGEGIEMFINNAHYDAFDADFSILKFKNIEINNSGNDCIDVSTGHYSFENSKINMCADKAVSVGEKSIAIFNNLDIENTNIGVASKDLSNVHITDSLRINNISSCLQAYQKKQEYGPAYIHLKEQPLNCKFHTPDESKLFVGKVCKKIMNNYFFESCLDSGNNLKIKIKNKIPADSYFFLSENKENLKTKNNLIQEKYIRCKVKDNCLINLKDVNSNMNFGLIHSVNNHIYYEEKATDN